MNALRLTDDHRLAGAGRGAEQQVQEHEAAAVDHVVDTHREHSVITQTTLSSEYRSDCDSHHDRDAKKGPSCYTESSIGA